MPSIQCQGESILPLNPELNRRLHRMNDQKNNANLGDGIDRQLPPPVDAYNQVILANPGDGA